MPTLELTGVSATFAALSDSKARNVAAIVAATRGELRWAAPTSCCGTALCGCCLPPGEPLDLRKLQGAADLRVGSRQL